MFLWRKGRPGAGATTVVALGPTRARDLAAKCLQLRAELLGRAGNLGSRRGIKVIKNSTELQLQHSPETNQVVVSINGRSVFLLNNWELAALACGLFALFDEQGQSEASPLFGQSEATPLFGQSEAKLEEVA